MHITQEELERLITCPKDIIKPPKRTMYQKNQSFRNELSARASSLDELFHVNFRQSAQLPENFSVILQWRNRLFGDIIIFRCNGPHGGGNPNEQYHFNPHTHRLNTELAALGDFQESRVNMTEEYSTFESAVSYFCSYCGIADAEKYFPFLTQPKLFDL